MSSSPVSLQAAFSAVVRIINTTENEAEIREFIRRAGVEPGVHAGDLPESFDQVKTTEYVLGQWAQGIDEHTPFLNTFRNITLAWLEDGKTLPVVDSVDPFALEDDCDADD
jgi:hypothetical protein